MVATEHRLELKPDTVPSRQMPYRMSHAERDLAKKEVEKMLAEGVIKPSESEWTAPLVLAPKEDEGFRFFLDYRMVNEATARDSYPMPRMDDCIDSLGEVRYFTTLDPKSGYCQIPVGEEDTPVTAFSTYDRLYEYTRMPFGLKNAPATFQRALAIVLLGYRWQTCLVYIDDVIVYSPTAEQDLKGAEEILNVLRQAGVSLNYEKCSFFTNLVRYLGHIVRLGRLEIDESHVASLQKAEAPTSITDQRSFLGFVNVYRRFIPHFTRIAKPLCEQLKGSKRKEDAVDWTGDAESAFRELIDAVSSPNMRAIPLRGLKYSMDIDTCSYQVGCASFQIYPDEERKPIGFWSRRLTSSEEIYSVSEKECLAVIYGIPTCRPYLVQEEFDFHTDHQCRRWLIKTADHSWRLMRWRLRLSEYSFKTHHKKGNLNRQADVILRLASRESTTEHENYEILCYSCYAVTQTDEYRTPKLQTED